jgi:hypothetical protein
VTKRSLPISGYRYRCHPSSSLPAIRLHGQKPSLESGHSYTRTNRLSLPIWLSVSACFSSRLPRTTRLGECPTQLQHISLSHNTMDDYEVYSRSHRNRRGHQDLNHAGPARPGRAAARIPHPQLSEDENEGSVDDSCEHLHFIAFRFTNAYCS